MKEKKISSLRRYETIYGVFIGAVPSLLFQIFPAETQIPFSWFLTVITILLIATWFCFASRAHAINDLEEANKRMESLLEYQNIKLPITHFSWNEQKMKFKSNVDTNLLAKGQCLAIYRRKDDYDYLCGVARIMEYDVSEKVAQANILSIDTKELQGEPPPAKEHIRLSPILDYDILEVFIRQYSEGNYE